MRNEDFPANPSPPPHPPKKAGDVARFPPGSRRRGQLLLLWAPRRFEWSAQRIEGEVSVRPVSEAQAPFTWGSIILSSHVVTLTGLLITFLFPSLGPEGVQREAS